MFLTPEELKTLTGYALPAYQARWLKRNGVRHFRQRLTGSIIVARAAIAEPDRASGAQEPDFGWMTHGKRKAA